ncbi:MAG: Flp family type IVb pilin [Rhizomicrobium sp.]
MGAAAGADAISDAGGRPAAHPHAARSALSRLAADASGATAIEYAMIASIISIVIFTAVSAIGTSLTTFFQNLSNAF